MINIFGISRRNLENKLLEIKQNKFRATQIFEWLYKKNKITFSEMTNMGKNNHIVLNEHFKIELLNIEKEQTSSDGTRKFLFRLEDGNYVETVLMNHDYGHSVCVSTQVGCNMGCLFCASGEQKKLRNLEVHEMVLQVHMINQILLAQEKRVSHVVIMGIGEPFDNYDNLLEFMRIINDPKGLEIGARHITVSTCGLVPKILAFKDFELQVNLAISLHFASDEKRNQYMKINKVYNIQTLFEALNIYYQKTTRRITFEYILLKDINDSSNDAYQLVNLLRNLNCYVNLIPMNGSINGFARSDQQNIEKFYSILKKEKINVTLRKEYGHDIDAACGQLRRKINVKE